MFFYLGVGSSWKCQLWRTLHDRSIAAWLLAVPLLLLLLLVLVSVDLSFGCFCYYHYFLKHCVEATRTSPSLGLQAMILFSCPLFSFLVARFHHSCNVPSISEAQHWSCLSSPFKLDQVWDEVESIALLHGCKLGSDRQVNLG